jgi:asparagine synthase (glutamine-hydrolysing)
MTGNFAVVVENDQWLFALVDRVGGYRLFYRSDNFGFKISNSAHSLIKKRDRITSDLFSITELKMAGYLTGNRTLYEDIFQLSAGEMILYNKKKNSFKISNYFVFYTQKIRQQNNDLLIDELDEITDKIITRNIKDANGKTIWVPLSGGLDSRLIICKLKQLGCDNLRSYSYGVDGNYDALSAKKISSTLNVQWDFIPTSSVEAREFFLSEERKDYWNFADGLSVVPNLHGMFAIKKLIDSSDMKPGDVVINGQSGDFITGQHIPIIKEQEINNNELLNQILKKNYSLRGDLFMKNKSVELAKDRIRESLGKMQYITNYQQFSKSYEYWGWKERQVKRVVNGQCNYDYFGLNWELPFWDLEYLQFWVDLPLQQKIDRKLFVEYLNKKNFYGLFDNKTIFMSRWPRKYLPIQFAGNIIKKIFGKNISSKYYKRLDWYSQYQYLYALTGQDEYRVNWSNYKGPTPYMTDVWLNENFKNE